MINKFFTNKKLKGIIVAMDSELTPILEILKPYKIFEYLNTIYYYNDKTIVVKSHIGEINAAISTQGLISLLNGGENLELIINIGLCGSLHKNKYKIGDVLMVKDVFHYDFDLSKVDNLQIGQYPNTKTPFFGCDISYFDSLENIYKDKIKLVRCASGDKFVSDTKFQQNLVNNFQADICEMESAAVVIAANKHNIPVIIIKAVSDIVQNENSQNEFLKSTKTVVHNYIDVLKLIIDDKITRRISSFNIDHNKLDVGFYTSRIDGDIFTYDLRFKKPNKNDYLPINAIHSIEHLMATYLRNSELKESVIYFGPMGCRTGFYLLLKNVDYTKAKKITEDALKKIVKATKIVGITETECGNSKGHDLEKAKKLCKEYLKKILNKNFKY
jgi:S-ribosylhomocysteine lyase